MGLNLPKENILRRWLELVSGKYSLLEEMLSISSEKYSSCKEENFEETIRLIEDRQGIIEKVDFIDLEIKQIEKDHLQLVEAEAKKGGLPDNLAVLWGDIGEKKRHTFSVLDRIRQLDGQYMPVFQQQLYSLKNQQKNLRCGRQTVLAYRNKAKLPQSLFVDEKE